MDSQRFGLAVPVREGRSAVWHVVAVGGDRSGELMRWSDCNRKIDEGEKVLIYCGKGRVTQGLVKQQRTINSALLVRKEDEYKHIITP